MTVTLDQLRRHAVGRSLFFPVPLELALERLRFVQADPIRAPARAQDLILRHRAMGYRAGELERRYSLLPIEEDVFITYGFVTRAVQALMHPRLVKRPAWSRRDRERAAKLLSFVRERGSVHPREVVQYFTHGTVRNYWGGTSNATTHMLEGMHYRGMLRVTRREKGIRIYSARDDVEPVQNGDGMRRLDALVDVAVETYAPLPAPSLANLVSRLRWAVPQWHGELRKALGRAKQRLAHEEVNGVGWYWPAGERTDESSNEERVRFLAPFDPVVWDRRRFAMLWGWEYRFEAYTPVKQRKLGYYALPLLWRDRVIGWANATYEDGELRTDVGYVAGRAPRDRVFKRELEAEVERLRSFLVGS
jgi:uncharacterized protein YcaQ